MQLALAALNPIGKTERLAYLKLMEKYRNTGPFKIHPLLGKNRRADPSHGKMMDLAVEELCRAALQIDDISATLTRRGPHADITSRPHESTRAPV